MSIGLNLQQMVVVCAWGQRLGFKKFGPMLGNHCAIDKPLQKNARLNYSVPLNLPTSLRCREWSWHALLEHLSTSSSPLFVILKLAGQIRRTGGQAPRRVAGNTLFRM